nr:uncharacterized protein LOC108012335 [Drosophila suzukii]
MRSLRGAHGCLQERRWTPGEEESRGGGLGPPVQPATDSQHEQNAGSVCLLENAPVQCGAFCSSLLHPVYDHNFKMQRQWVETQERLGRMENQLLAIQKALAVVKLSPDVPEDVKSNVTVGKFEAINSRQFYIGKKNLQDWNTSADTCLQMGGYLASFQSQEEFDLVKAKLNSQDSYWLGIHNQDNNNTFTSVSTGQPAKFIELPANIFHNCLKSSCFVLLHGGKMSISESHKKANYICQADDL